MKKYEVIQDFKGSPDGHTVIQFAKDSEIDHAVMGDSLAAVALEEKWVKEIKPSKKGAKDDASTKAAAEAAAQREASIVALQSEIDQLVAQRNAATTEDDKAKLDAEIEAKQGELDALLEV